MKRVFSIVCIVCILAAMVCVGPFAAGAVTKKYTITFDMQGIGTAPAPVTVNDGEKFLYLGENSANNPTADGYIFHCWTTTTDYAQNEDSVTNAAYLETPIHSDMTLHAVWYKVVDAVNITVDAPVAGDEVKMVEYVSQGLYFETQSPRPNATVNSEGVKVLMTETGQRTFWLGNAYDLDAFFTGKFKDRTEYGVSVEIEPEFGYTLADKLAVTFNGKALEEAADGYYANYVSGDSFDPAFNNRSQIGAPIMCGQFSDEYHTITFDVQGIGETPAPVQVKDGEKFLYRGEHSANNPTADGYVFHCWATTLDFEADELSMSNNAAYLETPVLEDMTLYAIWYKLVDTVDILVDPPVAGDVIGTKTYSEEDYSFDYPWPRPNAETTTEGVQVQENNWGTGMNAYWLKDYKDRTSIFAGTFEKGKEYGVMVYVEPVYGYEFAENLTVTLNGEKLDGPAYSDYHVCIMTAPIWCGKKPADAGKKDSGIADTGAGTGDEAALATGDQSKKNDKSSGSDSYAVQTGEWSVYAVMAAVMLLSFLTILYLRKKQNN